MPMGSIQETVYEEKLIFQQLRTEENGYVIITLIQTSPATGNDIPAGIKSYAKKQGDEAKCGEYR